MTTAGTWYPPTAGTGGFLIEGQLFTNPPFSPMTQDLTAGGDGVSPLSIRLRLLAFLLVVLTVAVWATRIER